MSRNQWRFILAALYFIIGLLVSTQWGQSARIDAICEAVACEAPR